MKKRPLLPRGKYLVTVMQGGDLLATELVFRLDPRQVKGRAIVVEDTSPVGALNTARRYLKK
jgi:hypothetical protein